jgi:hypothetical protein
MLSSWVYWISHGTEYCGQAPSAPLYIREVPGSNPGEPDQVWVFFNRFPTPSHRGMSHITDKAIAGSVATSAVPTTFLPYPSRIFPSMWLKRLWKASAARPPFGGMKNVSSSSLMGYDLGTDIRRLRKYDS